MTDDPRRAAAWRAQQAARSDRGDPEDRAQRGPTAAGQTELERAAVVETAIQQAIRQGAFDDLPGAGKPIPGLDRPYDPDWWVRQKIETEQLRGLGPPALALRVESAEFDARLDAMAGEADVRAALEDFNRRVVDARRQLLGGPPVVTPLRDVEAEVVAWRARRERRDAERDRAEGEHDETAPRRRRWRRS